MKTTINREEATRPILIFCEGISFGHTIRTRIIAEWLEALALPMTVACTPATRHLFAAKGYHTVPLDITDPEKIYGRLGEGKHMYEVSELMAYYRQDENYIKALQPTLIVSDFRFTALQLAKSMGIPSVGITDATCHPHFKSELSIPDFIARKSPLPMWLLEAITQKTPLGRIIDRKVTAKNSETLREASRKYGLEALPTFFDYASQGDLCLLCDHPSLIPINPLRPQDMYTGALVWEREEPLPAVLNGLDRGKKTVYVCLGTQGALAAGFLEAYVDGLLAEGLQVIVSRGKRKFSLAESKPHLYVFDFINESKLMPLIDLMVYPGGAMSTYQALVHGVPLLALPAHINQHFYAEAIVKAGVGQYLLPSQASSQLIVEKTMELLRSKVVNQQAMAFRQYSRPFSTPVILKAIRRKLLAVSQRTLTVSS